MATKQKNKSKKFKTLITPDGVAAFAKLTEGDETFSGPAKQSIDVHYDIKDAKVKKFFKLLKAFENKWLKENNRKPKGAKALAGCIKIVDEKLSDTIKIPVGSPYIKFSTNAKRDSEGNWIPVPVVGANGKRTNVPVYGTDLVAIETTISGWTTPQGIGIKCYLSAVQILESRYEGGAANAGKAFGVRDDFLVDDDSEEDTEIEDDDSLVEEDMDLDLGDDDDDDSDDDDPTAGMV